MSTVSQATLNSYIETALWTVPEDDYLAEVFDITDLAPSSIKCAETDLKNFLEMAAEILDELDTPETQIAHDFWLTRNGHGAGFWDGDYPQEAGQKLTELSKSFGEIDLYPGDDGLLYFAGYENYQGEEKYQSVAS